MRRFIATALLALFVLESSGAASAGPIGGANPATPLLVVLRLELVQTYNAFASTRIGAFFSGQETRYETTHAPVRPPLRNVQPLVPPSQLRLHDGVRAVPRFGTLVRVRMQNIAAIDAPAARPDPLLIPRNGKGGLQPHPISTRNPLPMLQTFPALSPPTTHAVMAQMSHDGSIKPMLVTAGDGSGTTGINPWWTYEEGAIPGAGKWMVNVATGNLIVQDEDIDIPERGIDLAFERSYNSQSQHDYNNTDGSTMSNYGNDWTNTFDAHLGYNATTNVMSVYDIDGARYDFTANGSELGCPAGDAGHVP